MHAINEYIYVKLIMTKNENKNKSQTKMRKNGLHSCFFR